jgi:hypothetical protein
MKSVIIITKDPLDFDHIAPNFEGYGHVDKVKDCLAAAEGPENSLVVDGPDGWFSLSIYETLINSFDESQREVFSRAFSPYFLAFLEFSTIAVVNIAINQIDIPVDSLVDNDHGLVTTIGEIRNLIRRSVPWTMLRPGSDSEQ